MNWSAVRRKAYVATVLTTTLTTAVACDSRGPAHNLTEFSDSAGVTIATYSGADRPLGAESRESFRLGGAPTGPESFYQLYRRWISISATGHIAVLNQQASQVSVFDSIGGHVLTVGREGDGPGELAYPSALMAGPEGGVGVFDYRKRALVRYSSEGSTLEQEPLEVPFNGFQGMVATPVGFILMSQTAPRGEGDITRQVLYLAGSEATPLGPAASSPAAAVHYESCGVTLTLSPLFASEVIWASNGRRTAVVTGAGYSVLLFEADKLVGVVRRTLTPETVTPAVVERELGDGEVWGISSEGECVVPPNEVMEARGYAAVLPVIQDLAVRPDGEVWVKRRAPDTAASVVDVFTQRGEYVGTNADSDLPFPVAFLPDGRAATIERDAVDIDRLVVYHLQLR